MEFSREVSDILKTTDIKQFGEWCHIGNFNMIYIDLPKSSV